MSFESLFDEDEKKVEEVEEKPIIEEKPKEDKKPKEKKQKPKFTQEQLEKIILESIDDDYKKILIIQQILEYTKTEKALHVCGEILKGNSLKRTNKKILARKVKELIDEKILGISVENTAKELAENYPKLNLD